MLEIKGLESSLKIKKHKKNENTFYYYVDRKRDIKTKKYIYGCVPCKFKKGTELEPDTYIFIKRAYVDWYIQGALTKPIISIIEFEIDEKNTKKEAIEGYLEEIVSMDDEFAFDEELGF